MKAFVNILSVFRIVAAFAVVALLLEQYFDWTFFVFAAAAASDWLDGFLARKCHVETKIGGVLDHMGDKFLVVNALIMMIMFLQIWSVLVPSILMICRELYVSGLREFMGTQKIGMPVPKERFSVGKVKTFVQMIALCAMTLWVWAVNEDWQSEVWTYYMLFAGIGGLWLALVCSLASAAQYTARFVRNLKKIK
jgi:CDP-diacylglycerol--glycerol-3-phosphate 3-phosphatidyltransferase